MKKAGILIFAVVAGAWVIWAAGFQEAAPVERQPLILDRAPVRIIEDPFPVFSGITMDVERGELVVADDSRFSLMTYRSQFSPTDNVREPIRQIRGENTDLGRVCGVTISAEHKEIYTVSGDGDGWVNVFPLETSGDVAPSRRFA